MRAAVRLSDPKCTILLCWLPFAATGALPAPGAHGQAGAGASRTGRPAVQRLCRQFSDYDHNGDGTAEITRLRLIDSRQAATEGDPEPGAVLVLVEPRLLRPGEPSATLPDLSPALRTFAGDLSAEGHDVYVILASVYAGDRHQDGRTVLALRRFLRQAWRQINLRGAVLVGNFPEATLVRQYYWHKQTPITLNQGQPNERRFEEAVDYLRDRAELVAWRADLVLADLDGRWDDVYCEEPEDLPYFIAVFPEGAEVAEGVSADCEFGTDTFEDFFFIHDGKWRMEAVGEGRLRFAHLPDENDECSEDDLALPNPMARPDILVSRINARHAGVRPRAGIEGAGDQSLLDANGLPQAVTFADQESTPRGVGMWEPCERTERQLLVEYFERNHRYRTGDYVAARKPACIATEFGSSLPEARQAFREWRDFEEPGYDIQGAETDLIECVKWLKRPALLRFLKAHSDPWGSTFAQTEDLATLTEELGGTVWAWKKEENRLVPGVENAGKLDLAIHRTLWQNRLLPDCAVMYFHTGCESIAPEGAGTRPYSDPRYGYWQGAESLLFYCNGIALVGRSKVFYDEPREFLEVLADGGTWGDAWAQYFTVESSAERVDEVGGGIGRKRAYFWGLLGDWTVTVYPGLGS
jgi:hypothetical protein